MKPSVTPPASTVWKLPGVSRTNLSPRGIHDMTGWEHITCHQRELIYRSGQGLVPASSLSDLGGTYGTPVVFTEWWTTGLWEVPVLRDYRYPDDNPSVCHHWLAAGYEAAAVEA